MNSKHVRCIVVVLFLAWQSCGPAATPPVNPDGQADGKTADVGSADAQPDDKSADGCATQCLEFLPQAELRLCTLHTAPATDFARLVNCGSEPVDVVGVSIDTAAGGSPTSLSLAFPKAEPFWQDWSNNGPSATAPLKLPAGQSVAIQIEFRAKVLTPVGSPAKTQLTATTSSGLTAQQAVAAWSLKSLCEPGTILVQGGDEALAGDTVHLRVVGAGSPCEKPVKYVWYVEIDGGSAQVIAEGSSDVLDHGVGSKTGVHTYCVQTWYASGHKGCVDPCTTILVMN